MSITNCSNCGAPSPDRLCFRCWYQEPSPFTRINRMEASEQTAIAMFKECRSMFIVDSIDSQLTCVWFS